MRNIIAVAALLPAVAGQAQTVDICDRTQQVRDAIMDKVNAGNCAAVDSEGLAGAKTLDLRSKRLTALRAEDFDGLTSLHTLDFRNLRTLRLYENRLTTLPAGVFDGLSSLQYLYLGGNQLAALPAGVFDELSSLQSLYLGWNQLTALPAGAFDGLTSLRTLDLDGNQLATLPAGTFDGLTRLQDLWLQDNWLTTLPAGAFDGLTSLRTLSLSGNQLATLPTGAFDGLTRLQDLWLQDNWLTTLPAGAFDGLTSLQQLWLFENRLTTLPVGVFDSLASLQYLRLYENRLTTLPDGVFDSLASLQYLRLYENRLTTLPDGVFDGLTSLRTLDLHGNQLTILPVGVFDSLTSLEWLHLHENRLTTLLGGAFDGLASLHTLGLYENRLTDLAAGAFDGLASLRQLLLFENRLTTLPDGVFDGLTSLQGLSLTENQLTTLPDGVFDGLTSLRTLVLSVTTLPGGVFDGLTSLQTLYLYDIQLTTLPAGVLDGLASLQTLSLSFGKLTTLPDGVFDGLTSLQGLSLIENRLTTLPAGVFDGLTDLRVLYLRDNQLTSLPDGVFDGRTILRRLDLRDNHLVGLTQYDALFAGLSSEVDILLDGQTAAARLAAAVPLMLSAADSTRQGFVRVVNGSEELGGVRVFAFDDGDHAPDPIEIQLGARQVVHFNSNDLEDGNAGKGVEGGVGGPVQGDWRLDVETDLAARVLAFVRHDDGFLTAMHDMLPKNADGRLVAHTFNPGGNMNQASWLRLVNTGANDERVSIKGVDDQGDVAGTVRLWLDAGESRTLSASDLETGFVGEWVRDAAGNLRFTDDGRLGDGAGKWRLLITAGRSVVGMSLLESAGGQLTNISTMGVATDGDTRTRLAAAVPLMLSAVDSTRQGFVRVVNESWESGSVRVFAFDDGGHAPDPIEIRLGAGRVAHFNSDDLEYGNAAKGLETGVGGPVQGDWRLDVETDLAVRVLAFIRHGDGFLTAMHDVLPRDADGRLVAHTFNPGDNMNQASSLRLVNTGANDESVSIDGVDDQGGNAGPVTLTLPAGESRTLSAFDLENGGQGVAGTLGAGAGKWRLLITAGRSVVGMSLLESAGGQLTNISTAGVASDGQ